MGQIRRHGKSLFSIEQRRYLSTFGLNKAQIDELEAVLPLCRVSLLPVPTRSEVRDEIRTLSRALKNAHSVISNLVHTRPQAAAKQEALQRVMLADTEIRDQHNCLMDALDAIGVAHNAVERSLKELPGEQKRRRANPFAIRRIDNALRNGFIRRYSEDDASRPPPPYPFECSSSPGSPFRTIVGVCYEAMGQEVTDPERAIKQYIRRSKKVQPESTDIE